MTANTLQRFLFLNRNVHLVQNSLKLRLLVVNKLCWKPRYRYRKTDNLGHFWSIGLGIGIGRKTDKNDILS